MSNRWVFINQTQGTAADGSRLTNDALALIANVVEVQLNADYGPECGSQDCSIRVSELQDGSDIETDEKPFVFTDTLPQAPGASAFHDVENGRRVAFCAVSTCADLFGPQGVGVDASHECLEDAGNPGCNRSVDDGQGQEHEDERCDAVEVQTYPITHTSGQVVYVSNFLLDSWKIAGAQAPYTFMTKHGIAGGVDPSGPFQTAPSPDGQGNYQAVFPSGTGGMTQVFAKEEEHTSTGKVVQGKPRKPEKVLHWTSRVSRIVANKSHVHSWVGTDSLRRQCQDCLTQETRVSTKFSWKS